MNGTKKWYEHPLIGLSLTIIGLLVTVVSCYYTKVQTDIALHPPIATTVAVRPTPTVGAAKNTPVSTTKVTKNTPVSTTKVTKNTSDPFGTPSPWFYNTCMWSTGITLGICIIIIFITSMYEAKEKK